MALRQGSSQPLWAHGLLATLTMDGQRLRYSYALIQAARTLGNEARLAALLHVDVGRLHGWLEGAETPPLPAFLAALDVIADGPYARDRPIRVAAIRPREPTKTGS
jgi:hypothetical protein